MTGDRSQRPREQDSDRTAGVAPHPVMPEYYGRAEARQDWVDGMFDRTAGDYDWITDIMSFGSGRWYRRWALQRYGVSPGMRLLDVGSGTGVIAQAAQQQVGPEGAVVALDPSRGMLAQAGQAGVVAPVNARAEALPLGSNAFHRLTMGYALRHVDDLVATFSEFRRVLAPGGRLLLLEITPPRGRFGYRALRFYLRRVVPLIARLGRRSRDAELLMRYYWDTIDACVPPERILEALQAAGLEAVQRHVIGGIFSEYSGTKPASVDSSAACQADQANA